MRSAIVIDETLPTGLLANAACCITSGLFNGEPEALRPDIAGDCILIPITKIAVLIFRKADNDLLQLLSKAKELKLKYMLFTRKGQSTVSYEEYIERVRGKASSRSWF